MPELQLIRLIDVADLEDIAIGGAILGTGGGGDPYIGKLMAQEAIRRHGPVKLVDVDGFADDALIAPVCMMGAPTVMTEKLPQGEEIVIALRKLEKFWATRSTACCAARPAASIRPRRLSPRPRPICR